MRKLNIKNILIALVVLIALGWLIGDLVLLVIGASYTMFGFITAILNLLVVGLGGDYLNDYSKKF